MTLTNVAAFRHPKLRPEWTLPAPPPGYDACVACEPAWSVADLDFVSDTRCMFASERGPVHLEWPWREGFQPTRSDWERIGFRYYLPE